MQFRNILPAIIGIAALSSCASAYRTGQTPDDVYYSPGRPGAAYVNTDQQKRDGRGSYSQGRGDYASYDDRWLRMRVGNRYRWSAFDDYDWNDYRYNSWSYGYNTYSPFGWNNYWNNYYTWNSWYNPYCRTIIVVNPKTNPTVYTKVRNFSLNSYTNTNYNTANNRGAKGMRYSTNPGYNNSNSTLGQSVRKVFSGGGRDSYSPSSSSRPDRTYTPSNNNSSNSSSRSGSSGSSGSSGGGVSRPTRGGN